MRTTRRTGAARHLPQQVRRVVAVIALLVVGSTLLIAYAVPALHDEPQQSLRMPWWLLTVMFGAAEFAVLHVQIKREARTVSVSEIPLVLALFFASPEALLVARILGPLIVFALWRRQALLKLAFNCALLLSESAIALAIFSLVYGGRVGPQSWIAAYAAAIIAVTTTAVEVTAVIALYEGVVRIRDLLRAVQSGVVMAGALGTVALVAVNCLQHDWRTAWLLVAVIGVVFLAYRAYASLSERHLSLERLYQFSQVVTSRPEVDEVLRSVLEQAKEMLRADIAEVTFLPGARDSEGLSVSLGATNRMHRSESPDLQDTDWLAMQVVRTGAPILISRGARDPKLRRYLAARRLREAILVPLRGDAGVIGTLTVADRLGDVRTFDTGDVRLLETVANHASVALQNGRLIDRLRHEALHDALTGLPNRSLLQRRAQEALDLVLVGRSPGTAVMIMDLDGFKEVNDTLGHQHGDLLLKEVAVRMLSAAGEEAVVARLGGDEFAVLLPVVDTAEQAQTVGRRLLAALQMPVSIDDLEIEVGASVGIALAPEHADDVSGLLKRADMAMYVAKGSALGVQVFEQSLDTRTPKRLALVGELRQALQLDQFIVHVQPKAELATGAVNAVEALVRWQHPELGLVGPDDFIPVAERSGLIRPLTSFVLRAATEACAQWRLAGLDIGVAVNLSARSLLDVDLADEVAHLLRRHELAPHLLTLEITESSIMSDPNRTIALLHTLAEMGVRLSLDDFGTGYSSLSYLKRLPVHEVKIDKSFVSSMHNDDDDAAIVRSVIDLGSNLHLAVVAEGVESRAVWDLLHEAGCNLAQGFYLSPAIPVEAFVPWLKAWRETHGGCAASPTRPARIAAV